MSELDKTKSELVVLQTISSHQGLMKVNRLLMTLVFFLMAVIVIAGIFFLPTNEFTQFKKTEATIAEINPVLSVEVNALKGQFVGLVSGSIESKLRSLEESIRRGSVSSSLGTVEDLKNDVKIFNYAYENTIDAYILQLLYTKIKLFTMALGQLDLLFEDVTDEESGAHFFKEYITAKNENELKNKFSAIGNDWKNRKKNLSTAVEQFNQSVFDNFSLSSLEDTHVSS